MVSGDPAPSRPGPGWFGNCFHIAVKVHSCCLDTCRHKPWRGRGRAGGGSALSLPWEERHQLWLLWDNRAARERVTEFPSPHFLGQEAGPSLPTASETTQVAPVPANSLRQARNRNLGPQWQPAWDPPQDQLLSLSLRLNGQPGVQLGESLFHLSTVAFISSTFSQPHFPEQDIKAREIKGFRGF